MEACFIVCDFGWIKEKIVKGILCLLVLGLSAAIVVEEMIPMLDVHFDEREGIVSVSGGKNVKDDEREKDLIKESGIPTAGILPILTEEMIPEITDPEAGIADRRLPERGLTEMLPGGSALAEITEDAGSESRFDLDVTDSETDTPIIPEERNPGSEVTAADMLNRTNPDAVFSVSDMLNETNPGAMFSAPDVPNGINPDAMSSAPDVPGGTNPGTMFSVSDITEPGMLVSVPDTLDKTSPESDAFVPASADTVNSGAEAFFPDEKKNDRFISGTDFAADDMTAGGSERNDMIGNDTDTKSPFNEEFVTEGSDAGYAVSKDSGVVDTGILDTADSDADSTGILDTADSGADDTGILDTADSDADSTGILDTADSGADSTEILDTTDSDGSGSEAEVLVISGCLIDEAGMIYGFVPEMAEIDDGFLALPSEGCTGIRSGAFLGNGAGIVELFIPSNVSVIEEGALAGLDSLEWIEAEEGNPGCMSIDGVLFDCSGTVLLAFPNGKTGAYIVPSYTVRIGGSAFYNTSLSKLDMRDCGDVEIGSGVFGNRADSIEIIAPRGYLDSYQELFSQYNTEIWE